MIFLIGLDRVILRLGRPGASGARKGSSKYLKTNPICVDGTFNSTNAGPRFGTMIKKSKTSEARGGGGGAAKKTAQNSGGLFIADHPDGETNQGSSNWSN